MYLGRQHNKLETPCRFNAIRRRRTIGHKDAIEVRTRAQFFSVQKSSSLNLFSFLLLCMNYLSFPFSSVDLLENVFEGMVQFSFYWEDEEFIEHMESDAWQKKAREVGWQRHMTETCWHPNVYVGNCSVESSDKLETWWRVEADTKTISLRAKVQGRFTTVFDLRKYPFDLQALSISLTCSYESKYCIFVPYQRPNADYIDYTNFALKNTYDLKDLVRITSTMAQSRNSRLAPNYSKSTVSVFVQRKPMFFVWNVYLTYFLLNSLAVSCYGVSVVAPIDRSNTGLTVLGISVTYKLFASENIPPISYLTALDVYILCGFTLVCCMVFQSTLCVGGIFEMDQESVDSAFFAFLLAFWVLINGATFLVGMVIWPKQHTRELSDIVATAWKGGAHGPEWTSVSVFDKRGKASRASDRVLMRPSSRDDRQVTCQACKCLALDSDTAKETTDLEPPLPAQLGTSSRRGVRTRSQSKRAQASRRPYR